MDLEHKIGQMIMVGFDEPTPDRVSKLITHLHLGGLILFSRNIISAAQLKSLTSSLQKIASDAGLPPLLISIDQEGGRSVRLGPDMCPESPTNWEIGDRFSETRDPQPVIEQARYTAEHLLALGINMNLAPVMDVVTVDGNEVINDRSYGCDKDLVSLLGVEYIKSLQKNGVIATAKHFPGHGPTDVDSHLALPTTHVTREEAENIHLYPFRKAVDASVDAVMTAHMVYTSLDPEPATLSHEILTNILRKKLGFNGVIITDDMNMLAIADNYTVEEAMVKAVNAGVDILLICSNEGIQHRVFNAVYEGVKSGEIKEEVIDKAVERILKLKSKYGL